jgi:hypothetical protein
MRQTRACARVPIFVIDYLYGVLMQSILEKFEFFPIKCRVQRSKDVFKIAQEHRNAANHKQLQFRLKVTAILCYSVIWSFGQGRSPKSKYMNHNYKTIHIQYCLHWPVKLPSSMEMLPPCLKTHANVCQQAKSP